MIRPTTLFFVGLTLAAFSAGCTGKDASDDSSTDDSNTTSDDSSADDSSADDSATDDSADGKIHFYLTLQEFLSQSGISGGTVTMGSETFTTDSSGMVDLVVEPHALVELGFTATNFRPFHIYRPVGGGDTTTTLRIASESTINLLSGAFSLELNPEAGLLSVPVLNWDGDSDQFGSLGGVTVDLDAAYDGALTADPSAPGGLAPGNTTVTDGTSPSSITFVNVTAGARTATLTPPEGYTCDVGASTFQIEAGHFTIASLGCHQ